MQCQIPKNMHPKIVSVEGAVQPLQLDLRKVLQLEKRVLVRVQLDEMCDRVPLHMVFFIGSSIGVVVTSSGVDALDAVACPMVPRARQDRRPCSLLLSHLPHRFLQLRRSFRAQRAAPRQHVLRLLPRAAQALLKHRLDN